MLLRNLKRCVVVVGLTAVTAAIAWAADATGKWTWTTTFGQNQVTQTLELKQEGEKLTGFLLGRNDQKTEISPGGTAKDNKLNFVVERERQGNKIKTTYEGVQEGDTIKFKITRPGRDGGQPRTDEVVAKRVKA
jgi:hypothetical protein